MKKELATFISGIKCIKRVLNLKPNRTLPQEAIVIDFGLDLAATESNRSAENRSKPAGHGPKILETKKAPQPDRGPAAISWPFITRTYQKLETLTSDFNKLSVPN